MRNRTQTIHDKWYLNVITCLQVKILASKEEEVQNPEILQRTDFWLSSTDKWSSQPEVCETLETTVDYITKMGEAATSQRRREELQCGPTPTQVIHSTGSSSE